MMKTNDNPPAIYLADYRVPDYLIKKTDLDFSLYEHYSDVRSRLQIQRNADQNLAPSEALPDLVLNGVDLELLSIHIDGAPLSNERYRVEGEHLHVQVSAESFLLEIETRIKPQLNTALEGLYVSKGMFCTQCEAHGFRRITYYLDRPDVMSMFDVRIEADKSAYPVLLSNGNPVEQGELDGGRHWASWQDPHPKPCYLFALVAGDLECVKDEFVRASGKPVSLELFVEKQDVDKCEYALESLKNAMRWDEEVFGREYDLDIYMIVAVNHFNMGAMENKGLNIFNTSCVLAHPKTTSDLGFERVEGVVAHEYFHNWSGNRVTCRDWFQLSLKEGFTVFRDEEFSSDMGSRTVKRIDDVNILRNFQFKEDAGPMAHSVRPSSYIEMNNFYTVTVYNKGAEVVRMLHTLLGAESFRKACDLYFDRFDGQAVTCDDFVACMEETAGRDFSQFKRWYSQAGTPTLEVTNEYNSAKGSLTLKIKQSCPATPGQEQKHPFVIPVSVAFFDPQGQKLSFTFNGNEGLKGSLLEIDQEEQSFEFEGLDEIAIPSLLRNFSAPVKVNYAYSKSDLAILMAYDDDGFNAWDACQNIYLAELRALVAASEAEQALAVSQNLNDALSALLKRARNEALDPALLARMLSLPSKSYLAEQYDKINVDAVVAAHNFLEAHIANQFSDDFLYLYRANKVSEPYQAVAQQVAKRSIKNTCLRYLVLSEHSQAEALATEQYSDSDNMTDQGSAFKALVAYDLAVESKREHSLNDFYQQWKHEALVLDQWFTVQATAQRKTLLEELNALTEHADFDLGNPNRVRSLLGAFAQNYEFFHDADGAGYRFYAQQIAMLNGINPQVAARMVGALIHWKRYEGKRGELMRAELESLKALPNLSKDVFEIVDKALA